MELPWQEHEVNALKDFYEAGLSVSQMASKIGIGRSRNAVLDRLRLEGLLKSKAVNADSNPRFRELALERPAPSKPSTQRGKWQRPMRLDSSKFDAPQNGRVTIVNLTNAHCRWPIGEVGTPEFCFCGQGPQTKSVYCPDHAQQARTKTRNSY